MKDVIKKFDLKLTKKLGKVGIKPGVKLTKKDIEFITAHRQEIINTLTVEKEKEIQKYKDSTKLVRCLISENNEYYIATLVEKDDIRYQPKYDLFKRSGAKNYPLIEKIIETHNHLPFGFDANSFEINEDEERELGIHSKEWEPEIKENHKEDVFSNWYSEYLKNEERRG